MLKDTLHKKLQRARTPASMLVLLAAGLAVGVSMWIFLVPNLSWGSDLIEITVGLVLIFAGSLFVCLFPWMRWSLAKLRARRHSYRKCPRCETNLPDSNGNQIFQCNECLSSYSKGELETYWTQSLWN